MADNAEARRGNERYAAVALVLAAGDQRVNRRGEAECAGVGWHVVDAPVGDHDRAGDAVGRNVGKRRSERREQARAVGFAVRLSGLDHTYIEPGNAAQPADDRGARFFGLPRTVAEILARTFIDDDHGDRTERVAILARQRRVGEREHHERQTNGADSRAATARNKEQQAQDAGRGERGPENLQADERGE